MNYDRRLQKFGNDFVGKTIASWELISYTQAVITFTDGTHTTFTAMLDDNKPWMATSVRAGAIEKEWRK